MGYRGVELDIPHAFPADLAGGYVDVALGARLSFVFYLFITLAMAFVVFSGTEDPFAEQAVGDGLEAGILDGLGLGDLVLGAAGPFYYIFRRRYAYFDQFELSRVYHMHTSFRASGEAR